MKKTLDKGFPMWAVLQGFSNSMEYELGMYLAAFHKKPTVSNWNE